jgi:hypothetical protein
MHANIENRVKTGKKWALGSHRESLCISLGGGSLREKRRTFITRSVSPTNSLEKCSHRKNSAVLFMYTCAVRRANDTQHQHVLGV